MCFAACGRDEAPLDDGGVIDDARTDTGQPSPDASRPPVFLAVNAMNQLIRFRPDALDEIEVVEISGLESGDMVASIDVRPSNGVVYALGRMSHLYRLDPETGEASVVGQQFSTVLSGSFFGMDVDPVRDRIRIVDIAQENVRVQPITGALEMMDAMLTFAPTDTHAGVAPHLVECAHTKAVEQSTTLYAIDSSLNALVRLDAPNNGTMTTVGPLGVDTSNDVGFDIATVEGADVGYVVLTPSGASSSSLYVIDLATGGVTVIGELASHVLHALTITP